MNLVEFWTKPDFCNLKHFICKSLYKSKLYKFKKKITTYHCLQSPFCGVSKLFNLFIHLTLKVDRSVQFWNYWNFDWKLDQNKMFWLLIFNTFLACFLNCLLLWLWLYWHNHIYCFTSIVIFMLFESQFKSKFSVRTQVLIWSNTKNTVLYEKCRLEIFNNNPIYVKNQVY